MFIYPRDLKSKPMLWLWELKDIAVLGAGLVLSVLALASGFGMLPLVLSFTFGFLSIRIDGTSVLDFLRHAVGFLFLNQQYYEWSDPH